MIVEVDPMTMMVEIKRFVIAHDCGTVINPLILDGQVHGGYPWESVTRFTKNWFLMKTERC